MFVIKGGLTRRRKKDNKEGLKRIRLDMSELNLFIECLDYRLKLVKRRNTLFNAQNLEASILSHCLRETKHELHT